MKLRLPALGLSLSVCAACLWLTTRTLSALSLGGMVEVKCADLVVTRVQLTQFPPEALYPSASLVVDVKNTGTADAPPCTLVLRYTPDMFPDMYDPPPWKIRSVHLPALAPGATKHISFLFVQISIPWRGMLLAAVDPAVAGKPSGEVPERSGEFNNVFGFTFNTGSSTPSYVKPIVWENLAAQ